MEYALASHGLPWQKAVVLSCYEVALAHAQDYKRMGQSPAMLENECSLTQEHVAYSQRFPSQHDASLAEGCSPLLAVVGSVNLIAVSLREY